MESDGKEYKMEIEGKPYIFKLYPDKLMCISDNIPYFCLTKDFKYEEIKYFIEKKKITKIKPLNGNELKITYCKISTYDEIKQYKTPDQISKELTLESNGKKFIKELFNYNIYISYTENEKKRSFQITQNNSNNLNNLDKDLLEYDFEMIGEGCKIYIENNKLHIESIESFPMKNVDILIDKFLKENDNFEEVRKRNENLIKEIKSKQSLIERDSGMLLKNLRIMKINAELISFPKKKFPIQKDDGINMDTLIISKLDDFKLIDNKLNQTFEKDVEYKLLYRASKDGDPAKIFKEKCKEKNTLTIVQTTDNAIFGGFTRVPWDDSDENKDDEEAFCFSVDNKKIYPLKKYCSAIGCDINSGPRFLYMFIIFNRFMAKGGELYPLKISHYNGQKNDFELNKGKQTFCVFELEVFKIKPKN
jgi:hypothetical protein